MILITTATAEDQATRNQLNREILSLTTQNFIRNEFNKSRTSIEAESWIVIAKEQGFENLSAEMQLDLETEKLIQS